MAPKSVVFACYFGESVYAEVYPNPIPDHISNRQYGITIHTLHSAGCGKKWRLPTAFETENTRRMKRKRHVPRRYETKKTTKAKNVARTHTHGN